MPVQEEFSHVLEEYERIIFHFIHKYGIRDPENEFYQEGVIALWKAYKDYDPAKGKFSTYAYFLIQKTFLTLIRKSNRQTEKDQYYIEVKSKDFQEVAEELDTGFDPYLYEQIKQVLTDNQMKWFQRFVLEDLSIKEIAEKEKVTIDAVKNWGRLAKPKVRELLQGENIR
ncbi:sigma-70 family RNA polymerase sigma factor [Virgibacillus sp. MSP4-1]|uniref:sigma-70 family RNA polymerase sigma factor n=1 Tax=Virgibacillus sp. MSP4-1 TaxID=2700081 RepID=UPI0003A61424|nr:sigma-70 family RNA polymerase sigma factor [Virgibacillus sp. MSP4-1]QHS23754.1 sigma-70 family RNA polymerase sigma factor [Virgibacillus sp. MSP4-1]